MPGGDSGAGDGADEAEDFMSDAFLASLEAQAAAGSGSGSRSRGVTTYSQLRKQTVAKQRERGYNKPLQEQVREKLDDGLNSAIPETNIGFQMLAKMGYKKGEALGASQQGLTEPIKVTIKSDKLGVGVESERDADSRKRARTAEELARLDAEHERARHDFRGKMNQRFGDRRVESDLHKARAACQTMDERAGVAMHAFWPAHVVAHAKEAEAAAAAAAEVAAAAADASSADDSYGQDEIPGATASEPGIHPFVVDVEGEKPEDGPAGDSGHESADADQVEPDFEDLEKAEQLRQVNAYLRERYFYCVWCGAVFADADEMAQECPGDTADDHEEL